MISFLTSRFEFANRRALFLSAYKATIYHWQKGELGSSYLFDVTEEGRGNFERYLRETPSIPVYMLVDLFAEEFRLETIPHVFGPDRTALIARKQARYFRDTPYCYTKIQGREEEGRKDDRIFLSSITTPDLIEPWTSLLGKYKIPLAAINSLSLFSELLIKKLSDPAKNILIVSLQSISGLRQTFFHNNELRISRLVKLPRYGTVSYGPYIYEEVEKVLRYLNSLRLLSPHEPLDIYILLAGDLLNEVKQKYSNNEMIRYHPLDLNELTDQTGSSNKITTPFSDRYFIYQYLKQLPVNHYASSKETRYSSLRTLRYSMLGASILLILAGVVWSGLNIVEGMTLKQSSLDANRKTKIYTSRYDIARGRLPKTPVEPVDLKVAVEIAESISHYKASPINMIQFISQGLNRFPAVRLDYIEWMASVDPNSNLSANQPGIGNQATTGFSKHSYTNNKFRFYQIAKIKGHLDPFDGDFREALTTINQFAENLGSGKAVHDVSIVSLPVDVSSTASLQGDTKSGNKVANFSVRIVLGIGNET